MVSPPRLRRSSRKRTATKSYYDISNPPPATQRRKATKSKKKVPSRDNDQQQSDKSPTQQMTAENTAGPSNRETASSASRGRKRKYRSDHGHDDTQAGPSNVARDVSDNRPRKQRVVEASTAIYPSIDIPPTTESERHRPVSRHGSGSIYQDLNQENIPPESERSTIIVSSTEPEHGWRNFRRHSQVSRQSVDERGEIVPTEAHEDARSRILIEQNDVTTRRLGRVEQIATKNENTINSTKQQLRSYEDKFVQMEEDIRELRAITDLCKTKYQHQNRNIQSLTERINVLEHNAATSRPAGVSDTQSIDARIMERLEEIRRIDRNAPYFIIIDEEFFDHFGIRWTQLRNVMQMPDEVYGAYYLRANAGVRIAQDTEAQRIADHDIIRQAEYITGTWLTTMNPDRYPANHLRERFAALFKAVCAREAIGDATEPPHQGLIQPAPRRPIRQLAPSAMER